MSAHQPSEPILHVDLDAFFASVEMLKDPSLRGRPVIVGGTGRRGVVCSASYEARTFGVRSAMPIARARRLCPDGIYLAPDFAAYHERSARFREVLEAHTPLVEPLSLDEAFLDVAGGAMLFGAPMQVAQRIRREVERQVGVTCSAGIAANKFVAKVASDLCKPDGSLFVPCEETTAFLHPLPVRRVWGVGGKTAETLDRLGIRTIGDLARAPTSILRSALGERTAEHLSRLARGIDERPVTPPGPARSIGHEATFERDIEDDADARRELLRLAGKVAARLRSSGVRARTVTIKVRSSTFTTLTRSRTLDEPTDLGADLYRVAAELHAALPGSHRRIRLLGIQTTGLLASGAEQSQLFGGHDDHDRGDLERTLDRITERFGQGSAGPASLLDRSFSDGSL